MQALWKMTWVETKLFLREPTGLFFTLLFPVMVLLLFTAIFGNGHIPGNQGLRMIDVMAPSYTGMVIGTAALLGLPITLAGYRQQGTLRRLRATPLHPSVILVAHVLVNLLVTTVGILLLLLTARIFYDLRPPEAPLSVALAFLVASLSFFALGFVLAGVLPTARTAQIVGQVVFFPMFFLSGAAGIQPQMFPDALRRVSDLLPLTYVVELVQKLWIVGEWDTKALVVLVCVAVASVLVSAATFRWE
jgi:ABC-2 type transport system permease protein